MTVQEFTELPLLQAIIDWANEQDDIKAVLLVGSQARTAQPADAFSDIDLTVTADDPSRYLKEVAWLNQFGSVAYTFVQQATPGPHDERRVAFATGPLVDFSFRSTRDSEIDTEIGLSPERAAVVKRGYRLLVDKMNLGQAIGAAARATTPAAAPDEEQFRSLVNEFWLRSMVTAGKLARGELWLAAKSINWSLAQLMETLLAMHAGLLTPGVDTWHNGRFLERWVEPSTAALLRGTLAPLEPSGAYRSLLRAGELFELISNEYAKQRGFASPIVDTGPAMKSIRNSCDRLLG